MAVPSFPDFFHPLLRVLARHPDGLRAKEAHDEAADQLGLTDDDRAEYLPSGSSKRFRNRVSWAQKHLKEAGLTGSPRYGVWTITDEGRAELEKHPDGFDETRKAELVAVFRRRSAEAAQTSEEPVMDASAVTPIEQIEDAVTKLREALAEEILDTLSDVSPEHFEQIVLDVLEAMGYGAAGGSVLRTGGTADGGIDGVITLDKLGLQRVGVQAKRWRGTVGSKVVQEFFGALAQRRAHHGVIITTSSFSRNAAAFAEQVSEKMVLVDGHTLARLMIEHEVGVSSKTVRMPKLDRDYFDEE